MRRHRHRHPLRAAMTTVLLLAALGATPAPRAAADTPPPLRIVTYNICGNMCAAAPYDNATRLDSVASQAAAAGWNADHLFLQEVCAQQYDALLTRLAPLGFQGHFGPTLSGLPKVCGGHPYGNAVLVRAPVTATADLDLTVGGESEPIRVPCVLRTLHGATGWACSVHLYWDDGTRRAPEARALAAQARTWRDQGLPVLLAGDFNDTPHTASTQPFYSVGFTEADPAATPTWNALKFDYVFATDPALTWHRTEVLPLDPKVSDHRLLRTTAETP
ncbi:endonuclease/exonuclease/phosphatase family protein [Streptomyces sp. NPDC048387]|uniref:endonuclease/exonuclease/phosphatase family protein n=1 Tax=Streptomyces sp. NPDC048387 TaxID=3365542 RepID=UPI003712F339